MKIIKITIFIILLSLPAWGEEYYHLGTGGTWLNYSSTDSSRNPPLWISRIMNRTGNNDYNPDAGNYNTGTAYFETVHNGNGTFVFNIASHIDQRANLGDAVSTNSSIWKYGAGHSWAGNFVASRMQSPGSDRGALQGIEIGLQNWATDHGPMDTINNLDIELGLWVSSGGGFPLTSAVGIYSPQGTGWYNGLWFLDYSIHPRGTAINMVSSTPLYGIKFGNVQPGGTHILGNTKSQYREVSVGGGLFINGVGNNGYTYPLLAWNSEGRYLFGIDNNGGGYLGSGGWYYASDKRLKKNVVYFNSGLNIINKLKPTKFDYVKGEKNQVGFVAQDIENILPASVKKNKEGMLSLKESDIIPYLVNAVKELSERVKILESKK
jgi:hypothetical protein